MAILDLRQFLPGHTIVIPRRHFHDVRELDDMTGAALMRMVSRVTRAVGKAFPNQGLSLGTPSAKRRFRRFRICTSMCTRGSLAMACCASTHDLSAVQIARCSIRMQQFCGHILIPKTELSCPKANGGGGRASMRRVHFDSSRVGRSASGAVPSRPRRSA